MLSIPQAINGIQPFNYRRFLLSRAATITLPVPEQYFDNATIWLLRELTATEIEKLKGLCLGTIYARIVRMKCSRGREHSKWGFRLQLRRPTKQALQYLVSIMCGQKVLITYVEVACDWAGIDVSSYYQLFDLHTVRKFRRRHYIIKIIKGKAATRYDAHRRTQPVLYKEDHSRITGEIDNLHLEWRAVRSNAVQNIGITTLQHMIEFDHMQFWKKMFSSRWQLYRVDMERLGRLARNKVHGTRSNSPMYIIGEGEHHFLKFNADVRTGQSVMIEFRRVQELVSEFGFGTVKPALIPIELRMCGSGLQQTFKFAYKQ